MLVHVVFGLVASVAMLPAAALAWSLGRADPLASTLRDGWIPALALAVLAPTAWTFALILQGWSGALGTALWSTIAASALGIVAAVTLRPETRGLTVLMLPYLAVMALLATASSGTEVPHRFAGASVWVAIHAIPSVGAYGALTVGAIAALSVFLQERALKAKQRGPLTAVLPAVTDAEAVQTPALAVAAGLLAVAFATGMAAEWRETGSLLSLTHKSILSLVTLLALIGLLVANARAGLRGRTAARLVLVAYLLLTLAYPGVKFSTEVLIAP